MIRYRALIIILLIFTNFHDAISQYKTYIISGYVKDAGSGEDLIGATVAASGNKVTVTNGYGFFSISEVADSVTLIVSYLGYKTQTLRYNITQNMQVVIDLQQLSAQIQEIEVRGDSYREQVKATQMSMTSITSKDAKLIPAFLGEVDLLKVLQLKPGIQSSSEGFSGIYVRGGGADQNLFLLDEAIVYNPSHLFGFFSVFNSDAVKNIDLYKGGFPAQYGGRLSSIVDVKMNEGNKYKYGGTAGIGLISSRLMLEGPIVKNKGSFIIAGRRTYADVFTRLINDMNKDSPRYNPIPDYYFYDFNIKINYEITPRNRLFLGSYYGNDVFDFQRNRINANFYWGNRTTSLRWNHIFGPKMFSNLSFTYSRYEIELNNKFFEIEFTLGNYLNNYGLKYDIEYVLSSKNTLKFGLQALTYQYTLGSIDAQSSTQNINFIDAKNLFFQEYAVYVSDDVELTTRLKVNLGLRMSGFHNFVDGKWHTANLEPRAQARYMLTENFSLKASYTRMYQYLLLVSNSGQLLPNDFWYPSTKNVLPQYADQAATGYNIVFGNGKYLFTNEYFYKWLAHQLDVKSGVTPFANDDIESSFAFGKGWAYGAEFYIEKKEGRFKGWIGYTLAWNWRQFPDIDNNTPYFARSDRRHDISIVLTYDITKRLTLSAIWVYGSGNAVTLPTGRYLLGDLNGTNPLIVPDYPSNRGNYRLAPYHRMDVALVYKFTHKWGNSDLTFSLFNLYNRRNAFYIYIDEIKEDNAAFPTGFTAKQVSLFPLLPGISYNIKF
ncbi:MAG: TonB-dependent receptor [Cytophagales bacterium]|nr:TonB-dependent receptor [Cytophagales bacterium]